jgi:hypothetical protein
LESFREKEGLVIGMMMREPKNVRRENVFREIGLAEVHEDVFSTDRIQDADLRLRDKGTRNAIDCFVGCLEGLIGAEGSGWGKERIERVKREAMKEVCIVGKKS